MTDETIGWGWVLLVGGGLTFLASPDAGGRLLGWLFTTGVVWVWGLPYVAAGVTGLGVAAVLAGLAVVGWRAWRRWGR